VAFPRQERCALRHVSSEPESERDGSLTISEKKDR
jgi:hypothetical protein